MSTGLVRQLSAFCGIVGVLMIIVSFSINAGPPAGATAAQLAAYGTQNAAGILWGAWLQTVGPVLIVVFAYALVVLAGASNRLAGWLTFFGGIVLVVVSLMEVTIYISALMPEPADMATISIALGHAIQHLYFVIAAPSLFLPLGYVLYTSTVLPRVLAVLVLIIGAIFAVLGITTMLTLILPPLVTAFAAVQALWWLAAAITLIAQRTATQRA